VIMLTPPKGTGTKTWSKSGNWASFSGSPFLSDQGSAYLRYLISRGGTFVTRVWSSSGVPSRKYLSASCSSSSKKRYASSTSEDPYR
jgi:hypothetical protein